jgi:hypothetical protein
MATSSADFNAQIIEEFHANQGRVDGIFEDAPLLLLHHTGAKSDKNRINPSVTTATAGDTWSVPRRAERQGIPTGTTTSRLTPTPRPGDATPDAA